MSDISLEKLAQMKGKAAQPPSLPHEAVLAAEGEGMKLTPGVSGEKVDSIKESLDLTDSQACIPVWNSGPAQYFESSRIISWLRCALRTADT